MRVLMMTVVVALLVLLGAPPAVAQEMTPYLEMTGHEPVAGTTADGHAIIRVFFRTYATRTLGQDWTGHITAADLEERLQVDGRPPVILEGPVRLLDDAKPVPLVLLLAIDVSGSMGGVISENSRALYTRRWEPLKGALESFLDEIDNESVYVQLFPWGHQVPFSVGVSDVEQHLDLWLGRYLPLDESGRAALLQGVKDIDTFIRHGNRNVHTALYGAGRTGVDELNRILMNEDDGGDPRFDGAKPVLILLTDGQNDPKSASASLRATTPADVVTEVNKAAVPVPVYTIGFGVDNAQAVADLTRISAETRGKFTAVTDDADARTELTRVYNQVLEIEGNSWRLDLDAGKSLSRVGADGCSIVFVNRGDRPEEAVVHDRMLLWPSALVALNTRNIGVSLVICAVILIILVNVWYFTRPKEDFSAKDETRGGAVIDEEVPVQPVESRAVGMKEKIEELRRLREQSED